MQSQTLHISPSTLEVTTDGQRAIKTTVNHENSKLWMNCLIESKRKEKNGRVNIFNDTPRLNEIIEAVKTNPFVSQIVKEKQCSPNTVKKVRKYLIERGELNGS